MKEATNIIALLKGLTKLNSVDEVRRENNCYALTGDGKVEAISISGENTNTKNLRRLMLGDEAIFLKYLNLSGLSALREIVFKQALPELLYADLSRCALVNVSLPIGFQKLEQLYLHNNKLQTFHAGGPCPKLLLLDLANNQLTDFSLPPGFTELAYLYLPDNKLNSLQLPEDATQLNIIHLENNRLKSIPGNIQNYLKLETIYLGNNPLEGIPKEIVSGDKSGNAITTLIGWLQTESDIKLYLHQAKMILVGNGMVGKTSIALRLLDRKAKLPMEEDRTPCLVINDYIVRDIPSNVTGLENSIDFNFKIWDFGGQGKYREIQQLFCSRKSLYIFVTSPDDQPLNDDYIGYEYWLSMVNTYSHEMDQDRYSPVLYVLNKIDLEGGLIDEIKIKSQFPNVEQFVKISADKLQNFDAFENIIRNTVSLISPDIFTDSYSERWFEVIEKLKNNEKETVHYAAYKDLCNDFEMSDEQQYAWIWVLDRIGEVIYFGDNPELKDTIVLDPEWVKNAFVNVVDSPLVQAEGYLKKEFHNIIWNGINEESHDKLIKLLVAYKLAYPVLIRGNNAYVVPSALFNRRKPMLDDYPHLKAKPDYQFKLIFDPFIPAGTVNKLMVVMYRNIYNDIKWYNGCILHDPSSNTYAEIEEDWKTHGISMKMFGKDSEGFYNAIITALYGLIEELKATKYLDKLYIKSLVHRKGTFKNYNDLVDEGVEIWNSGKIIAQQQRTLKTKVSSDNKVSSGKASPEIFFSYAWGDKEEKGESREAVVNEVYEALKKEGYIVIRDKMDLGYRGFISEFIDRIGKGDLIVVVTSDKYFRSPYCMYELYKIALDSKLDKHHFTDRILPIAVEFIDFADPVVFELYDDYWESKYNEMDDLFKRKTKRMQQPQFDLFKKIRTINENFGNLSGWISDMNCLNLDILSKSNFEIIRYAIEDGLRKNKEKQSPN
ncbi:MAG: TIR domain-containing protein [Bacteroidetes bacterium]|nr:TIR domain-containing protein [Bacteroidota bacterium]MBU1579512.1 TIR domain-containing protein [Bacteroidota bacterium]MBU2558841.1 TIR domain-containing protein [Bacteroidota bacterium]